MKLHDIVEAYIDYKHSLGMRFRSQAAVLQAFNRDRIRQSAEIRREATAQYQPRIHDIRHSAAVHRVIAWYRAGADVQKLLPQLATYLGHVDVASTQRYLTMTAELQPTDRLMIDDPLAVSAAFIPGISGEGTWLQRRYAQGDIPSSVRAMLGGAEEFLEKSTPKEELVDAVKRALARNEREREERTRQRELRARFDALSERELEVLGHVVQGSRRPSLKGSRRHFATKPTVLNRLQHHTHMRRCRRGRREPLQGAWSVAARGGHSADHLCLSGGVPRRHEASSVRLPGARHPAQRHVRHRTRPATRGRRRAHSFHLRDRSRRS